MEGGMRGWRKILLNESSDLAWPVAPPGKFNKKPLSSDEIKAVVLKARVESALRPSGVSYQLKK